MLDVNKALRSANSSCRHDLGLAPLALGEGVLFNGVEGLILAAACCCSDGGAGDAVAVCGVDGEGEAATDEGVIGAGVPTADEELRPRTRANSSAICALIDSLSCIFFAEVN